MKTFKDYSLSDSLAKGLDGMGITSPTEIQEKALTALLGVDQADFHGQSQTGTGKTLAFGIPLLESIDQDNRDTQALIMAPTRELAVQICQSLREAARYMNVSFEAVYGGASIINQIRALKKGVHVVVGTPGRLNDHLKRKTLSLKNIRTIVLDEADTMLDMGFKEEVDAILEYTPANKRVWLFSATVKAGIRDLKKNYMRDPISVSVSAKKVTATTTEQFYCMVSRRHKLTALSRFIDSANDFYGVIFCATKVITNEVFDVLRKHGYAVNCLHGDIKQSVRDRVTAQFKRKEFTILVATDVAARGLDVPNLTHVVNYSVPTDEENYVHRIGRTGRAGKDGVAITFLGNREVHRFMRIAKRFNASVKEIEVPTVDDVIRLRLGKALEAVTADAPAKLANHVAIKELRTKLDESSKDELVTTLANVVCNTVLKGCDAREIQAPANDRFERGGERRERGGRGGQRFEQRGGGRGIQEGMQELMIPLGERDGVSKSDVAEYLGQANVLQRNDGTRIRVIQHKTFIVVAAHHAGRLVKTLRGQKLNGKRAFISYA